MTEVERKQALEAIFSAVVAAAHPAELLAPHLPPPPRGRVILLAAGKAAGSMAAAAAEFYAGTHGLDASRLVGLAVTRDGYACDAGPIAVVEAGHPLPNAAGLEATRRILDLAEGAGEDDLVLALISGGGSANWLLPRGAITLADKQAVTRALLKSGAGIGEINCIRKHLSQIKGGRLAAACPPGASGDAGDLGRARRRSERHRVGSDRPRPDDAGRCARDRPPPPDRPAGCLPGGSRG